MDIFTVSLKVAAVLVVSGIVALMTARHDEALAKSASRYERCIKAEYGMSPNRYYSEHGVFPVCTTADSAQ